MVFLLSCSTCAGDPNAHDGFGSPSADVQGTADGSAPANRALYFNGGGQYASTGTARFPIGSALQTISLWVRYPVGFGTQTFVALRSDTGGGIKVGLHDGTLSAWTVYGSRTLAAAPKAPAAGRWHHVAYVFDGVVNRLYLDGAPVGESGVRLNVNTYVASWLGSADGLTEFYAGALDEIRIWNVARSSADVAREALGKVVANEPGLVAYFNCDVVDGTRVPDNSGNGNDATLGGGAPDRMPTLVPSNVPPGR